jgi:hypothetical protein
MCDEPADGALCIGHGSAAAVALTGVDADATTTAASAALTGAITAWATST